MRRALCSQHMPIEYTKVVVSQVMDLDWLHMFIRSVVEVAHVTQLPSYTLCDQGTESPQLITLYIHVASYPGLPMFFNLHEKNLEGLVDFGDVMDVVCDDAYWNE